MRTWINRLHRLEDAVLVLLLTAMIVLAGTAAVALVALGASMSTAGRLRRPGTDRRRWLKRFERLQTAHQR